MHEHRNKQWQNHFPQQSNWGTVYYRPSYPDPNGHTEIKFSQNIYQIRSEMTTGNKKWPQQNTSPKIAHQILPAIKQIVQHLVNW